MNKFLALTTTLFAFFLVVVSTSGCTTVKAGVQPCDVLVYIPPAPPEINRILVKEARPTAIGIARHSERFKEYKCTKPKQ